MTKKQFRQSDMFGLMTYEEKISAIRKFENEVYERALAFSKDSSGGSSEELDIISSTRMLASLTAW